MAKQQRPTYYNDSTPLTDDLSLNFKGENWDDKILDTEVQINDLYLCWISWENREAFAKELNAVIEKYRI